MAIVQISIRQKENKIKSCSGAVNYVLGMIDGNKEERKVAPKIVLGDADLIRDYDKHPSMSDKNKSTSGVIAFRDNEKLDKKQENELIDLLQKTAIPKEYRGKVDMLVVKHEDKGNTEYHFIIPHLTNEGEKFNPWPCIGRDRGKTAIKTGQAITRLVNDTFNFEQVLKTRQSNGLTSAERKIPDLQKTKRANQKAQIIHNIVRTEKIQNRDQLIEHLKKKGIQISRAGDNYISIKQPGEAKAMRLSGGIFSKDSTADYQRINSQIIEKTTYTAQDRQADIQLIKSFHALVVDRFEGKQHNQTELLQAFNQCEKQANKLELKIETPKPTANKVERQRPLSLEEKTKNSPTPTTPDQHQQPQQTAGQGLSGQAVSSGVGEAEASLQSALSELSQAEGAKPKDMNRVLKAKIAVAQALAQVEQAKKLEAEQQDNQRKRYRV